MIIRSYFKCSTCNHPHIVRIGMGQEEYQTHKFSCSECGEDMTVALHVDYENIESVPEAVENAELIEAVEDATVVNVHANFPVPEDQRHVDRIFPHLPIMHDAMKAAEERGSLVDFENIPPESLGARPFQRPDFAAEWRLLKKAWTLHRNRKEKLSQRQIAKGSELYYSTDPLGDLADWIWRFLLYFPGPVNEPIFRQAFKQVSAQFSKPEFEEFFTYYNEEMSTVRADRYLALMREYFAVYSEVGQVFFQVSAGVSIPEDYRTGSTDFAAVRMLYGNVYEAFTSSVDLLAYINNLQCGRSFSTFQSLTQKQYLQLDKSGRFRAFSLNAPFMAICAEADNQLRNASHHGSFSFDAETQVITYRSGKGGLGPAQQITYRDYLCRSTRLFLQMMILFRIEMLMCEIKEGRKPI